jgi:hypothetical protein
MYFCDRIKGQRPQFGCDPEIFLRKGGKLVDSSEVVPEDGIKTYAGGPVYVVRDGVQAELQPTHSHTCREVVRDEIRSALAMLKHACGLTHEIDFTPVVEIDEETYESLPDPSKKLGCMPSRNVYGQAEDISGTSTRTRSAGGHIHLGLDGRFIEDDEYERSGKVFDGWQKRPLESLVVLLDILLGNSAVLLDRNEGAVKRRRFYGRAGEYRTPIHGLEYRVLSNFWLRAPLLWSLVSGIARQAVILWWDNKIDEVVRLVEIADIQNAINHNDRDLALANLKKIAPLMIASFEDYLGDHAYPLAGKNIECLIEMPAAEELFPNPLAHWSLNGVENNRRDEDYYNGWERFAARGGNSQWIRSRQPSLSL